MVPIMQISKTWKSNIKLTWNEIPFDQRNGIIQSYKVFYWKEKGPINSKDLFRLKLTRQSPQHTHSSQPRLQSFSLCLTFPSVVTADLQERTVVLENLDREIEYESFLMVSTYGGSLNGSRIHFEVEPFGWYTVQLHPASCSSQERIFPFRMFLCLLDVVTVITATLSFGVALTVFIIIMIRFSSHRW